MMTLLLLGCRSDGLAVAMARDGLTWPEAFTLVGMTLSICLAVAAVGWAGFR